MNTPNINIRSAQQSDLSEVYALIKALAVFEKEFNEPENSFDQFTEDFNNNLYGCLVAFNADGIIGMALYFYGYSTWKGKMLYLDDLVVKESYRQQKIGSQLFNAIIDIAKNESANVVRWQVLDWNQPAISMYEKVNASFGKDWWNCQLEKNKILNYKSI